jgi:hypothetical protein
MYLILIGFRPECNQFAPAPFVHPREVSPVRPRNSPATDQNVESSAERSIGYGVGLSVVRAVPRQSRGLRKKPATHPSAPGSAGGRHTGQNRPFTHRPGSSAPIPSMGPLAFVGTLGKPGLTGTIFPSPPVGTMPLRKRPCHWGRTESSGTRTMIHARPGTRPGDDGIKQLYESSEPIPKTSGIFFWPIRIVLTTSQNFSMSGCTASPN